MTVYSQAIRLVKPVAIVRVACRCRITFDQLLEMAVQMRRMGEPMLFNDENWGLANYDLEEQVL